MAAATPERSTAPTHSRSAGPDALRTAARYARYDYLEHRTLVSPRFALTLSPADRLRVTTVVSRQAQAPGAEEFLPPADAGIWLPPQRTFSSLERGEMLDASNARCTLQWQSSAILRRSTIAVRAFRQHVDDQLVTLFGVDLPVQPGAKQGHYLLATRGDVTAQGCTASLSDDDAGRVQGSRGLLAPDRPDGSGRGDATTSCSGALCPASGARTDP